MMTANTRARLESAGDVRGLNGRELLMTLFLASILVSTAGSLAALITYLAPPEPLIVLGTLDDFPPSDAPYYKAVEGHQVFIVNTGDEVLVFNANAPYDYFRLFTLMKWIPEHHRFEDPCCGSKFTLTGAWIEGPSPRSLDSYPVIVSAEGTLCISQWKSERGKDHE